MMPLLIEENESYNKPKMCHISKKEFIFNINKNNLVVKLCLWNIIGLEIIVILLENIEELLIVFVT